MAQRMCYATTMKRLGGIVISILIIATMTQPVLARSGCCSYHGGVRSDGCGCNDGTALSSTCAPYYQCTSSSSYGSTSYTAPSFEKTYNGVTYYSQSSYDAAVAEAEFETNHKQAIKDAFQSILGRAPSDDEAQQWFDYSRNIEDINNALLATDEYKEILFQQEHKANIRVVYKEITGEDPSDAVVGSLADSSRDIEVIEQTIQDEYGDQNAQPEISTENANNSTTSNSTHKVQKVSTAANVIAGLIFLAIMIGILSVVIGVPLLIIILIAKALRKK